jgi:hypothetical protein
MCHNIVWYIFVDILEDAATMKVEAAVSLIVLPTIRLYDVTIQMTACFIVTAV